MYEVGPVFFLEVLPDLVSACSEDEIRQELERRPHATHVRLPYLIEPIAPDIVARLSIRPAGKVWFRPRRALRRHDAKWNVADTILPISPREVKRDGQHGT